MEVGSRYLSLITA